MENSSYYLGESGAVYFQAQSKYGEIDGQLIAKKFQPYIAATHTVLDFGCGGGFALKHLECGRRIGIEVNPVARAAAARNGVECYEDLDHVADGMIDVAISHHAVEHVTEPLTALRNIRRKLKPDGLFILIVPIDDWRRWREYDPNDIHQHLYTWNPVSLGNLLRKADFAPTPDALTIKPHGWFRGYPHVYDKLPQFAFDAWTHIWCFLRKTREIHAVVRRGSGHESKQD